TRFHRSRTRSGQGVPRQENGWPNGQQDQNRTKPRYRSGRCRTRPAAGQGRRARPQERQYRGASLTETVWQGGVIMELKLLNDQGQASDTVAAPATIFGRDFNEYLVHQVVVAYQANARSGNRAQKNRSQVAYSGRKPWRQKGTGRARAGAASSPMWRGGGRTFPSTPDENFSHKVNK